MLAHASPDSELVERGRTRLDWIRSRMVMLGALRAEFEVSRPFANLRIGVSLHLEPKTAVLLEVLHSGGAEIVGTGNYGSTQDDIVAFLRDQGIIVFGRRDDTLADHHLNLAKVLKSAPHVLLDNGADLVAAAIENKTAKAIVGATEETTSGGNRLRSTLAGLVPFPSIVINDSPLKQIAENRHAVGQSIVESFMRVTNLMVNGRRFVVIGYGWCGRGIAQYLRALGGRVAVSETDEVKALEAALDGYRVSAIDNLAPWGEVFITATGCPNVMSAKIIRTMASGAILANAGHFDTEIEVRRVRELAVRTSFLDKTLERLDFNDGRHVIIIAGGRMFNLAGEKPNGNSIDSMDIGFMLQALSLQRVASSGKELGNGAQPVPDDINRRIARQMLTAMKTTFDHA